MLRVLGLLVLFCALAAGCAAGLHRADSPTRVLIPTEVPPGLPPAYLGLVPVAEGEALTPSASSFDVSGSGEATWELPLWMPEGRNDIAPKLAISYASRRGSGILGKGFALTGLSSITRCWRTPATDGAFTQFGDTSAGIAVGVPDALCLDGERLVARAAGSMELQPETDPSVVVRITAGTLAAPVSFDVWHADGKIWRYGSRDDGSDRSSNATLKGAPIVVTATSLDPSNHVPNGDLTTEQQSGSLSLTWYVDEVVDRWGNFMEVDYYRNTDPNGLPGNPALSGAVEVVPHWMRWTGHHGTPVLYPSRTVEFQYQTAPDGSPLARPDSVTSYRGGLAVRDSRWLEKIIVSGPDRLVSSAAAAAATPFREYGFTWLVDASVSAARLASIVECIDNPHRVSACKHPISFAWSAHPTPSFQAANVLNDAVDFLLPSQPYPFAEDMQTALLETQEADVWYSIVGDFDGDGRDDLLYRLPKLITDSVPARPGNDPTVIQGEWWIRRGSPTGLGPREKVSGIPVSFGGAWQYAARAVDVDSDGKAEVLAYHEPLAGQVTAGSGSDIFRFSHCSGGTCFFDTVDIQEDSVAEPWDGFPRRGSGIELGDFNGDGTLDLVRNSQMCNSPIQTLCPPVLPVTVLDNLWLRLGADPANPLNLSAATPVTIAGAGVGGNLSIHPAEPRYVVDIDGNGVPEIVTTTYNTVPNEGPPNFMAPFLSSVALPARGSAGSVSAAIVTPLLLHARPVEQSSVVQPSPQCVIWCTDLDHCSIGTHGVALTQFTRYFVDLNGDGLPDSVAIPSDNADSCPVPTFHGSEMYVSMNAGGVFRPPVRIKQTTYGGFNPSLDRDDSRVPIGPPLQDDSDSYHAAPSVAGRPVDPGARFVDLDGDGRIDIVQMSEHIPDPGDRIGSDGNIDDLSQRTSVVWIRSIEGGFADPVDLKAGPSHASIPAAPQQYHRVSLCPPADEASSDTPAACALGGGAVEIAGGYGARMSQLGDFNGDGTLDIVTLVGGVDDQTYGRLEQFLGQPSSPDLVTHIDAGPLSQAIDVSYGFAGPQSPGLYTTSGAYNDAGNPRVCTPPPCDFGQTIVKKLGWVVEHYSIEADQFTDASPLHNVYRYTYDTARSDTHGRGFLGVDQRQRVLTGDENTERYERQILTFDHSLQSRVIVTGTPRYIYANAATPARELLITPITAVAPGRGYVADTRHARSWTPRGGALGFSLAATNTIEDRCEIPGNGDALIPHPCGQAGATLISSTHREQEFDGYGTLQRRLSQVAIDESYLDQNGLYRALNPPPAYTTLEQLTGVNNVNEGAWLVNQYSAWNLQSLDPTLDTAEQDLRQNGSVDYFPNRVEVRDLTVEPIAAPESDSVSGFTHTTTYQRDAGLGVVTGIVECASRGPCPIRPRHFPVHVVFTSRHTAFGFDASDPDRIFYASTTDALGHVSRSWPHATLGVPCAVDDQNQVRTRLTFDSLGRPREIDWPGGASETYGYVFDGATARTWTLYHQGAVIPDTEITFDPRGLVSVAREEGFNHFSTRTFTYDRFGRLSSESLPGSPHPGVPHSGIPLTLDYVRDGLGRVIQSSRPGETATAPRYYSRNTYDGRTETRLSECIGAPPNCTGGRGAASQVQRDSKGRPAVLSESDASGNTVKTQIEYWHFDLPRHIVHPLLPSAQAMTPTPQQPDTVIEYDLLGRRAGFSDSDTGPQTYLYNSFGEVKSATDGNGASTVFGHDALGRLISTQTVATANYPARGGNYALNSILQYDVGANAIGKLSQVTSVEGIVGSYQYDGIGRLHQQVLVDETGASWAVLRDYDSLGRLATLTYPALAAQPFRIAYDYAGNGAIATVWNASGPTKSALWTQIERNDANQSTWEQFGDTETVNRNYDESFNLRDIAGVFSTPAALASQPYQTLHYDWGVDNLLSVRKDLDLGIVETYEHDFLGRLATWNVAQGCTAVTPPAGGCSITQWGYHYDDWGNIRTRSIVNGPAYPSTLYEYTTIKDNSRPHAVKRVTTGKEDEGFAYDNAGQLRFGRRNAYQWMPGGLPFQISNPVTRRQSTFLYDGLGQRVVAQEGSVGATAIDQRIVSVGGLFEYRSGIAGSASAEYIYNVFGGDGLVAQIRRAVAPFGETVNFVHPDQIGNPDAITTVALNSVGVNVGQMVERGKYEPFGERRDPLALATPHAQLHAADASVGFTGHEPDDSFELVNMRGRIYDPKITRFISPDPFASPTSQALNRYSYVWNSPVMLTDPSGYQSESASASEVDYSYAESTTYNTVVEACGSCSAPALVPATSDENSTAVADNPSGTGTFSGDAGTQTSKKPSPQADMPEWQRHLQVYGTPEDEYNRNLKVTEALQKEWDTRHDALLKERIGTYTPGAPQDVPQSVIEAQILQQIGPRPTSVRERFLGSMGTTATLAAAGLVLGQALEGNPRVGTLLRMEDAAFQGGSRTVAGYEIAGTWGRVGETYNVNLWGVYKNAATPQNVGQIGQLLRVFRQEAQAAGASRLSIVGVGVINENFAAISPSLAARYGMTVRQIDATTVLLQGGVF